MEGKRNAHERLTVAILLIHTTPSEISIICIINNLYGSGHTAECLSVTQTCKSDQFYNK